MTAHASVSFDDTAASMMGGPMSDKLQVYEVIKCAHDAWQSEHLLHASDYTTIVELHSFPNNDVDLIHLKSIARLQGVYDIEMKFAPELTASELKISIRIARASVNNNGLHPKDSEAVFKHRTSHFEKVIDTFDPRDMSANWVIAAEQLKRLAHVALNQRKRLPYRTFDLSVYPAQKAYGLHINNMDALDYQFLRALSTAADIIALPADIKRRELEIRLSGDDPVLWPRFTLTTSPKDVNGNTNNKRSSGGIEEIDTNPSAHKRAAP